MPLLLVEFLQGALFLTGVADFGKQLKDLGFSRTVSKTMHRKIMSFLIKCFLSPEENLKAAMIVQGRRSNWLVNESMAAKETFK